MFYLCEWAAICRNRVMLIPVQCDYHHITHRKCSRAWHFLDSVADNDTFDWIKNPKLLTYFSKDINIRCGLTLGVAALENHVVWNRQAAECEEKKENRFRRRDSDVLLWDLLRFYCCWWWWYCCHHSFAAVLFAFFRYLLPSPGMLSLFTVYITQNHFQSPRSWNIFTTCISYVQWKRALTLIEILPFFCRPPPRHFHSIGPVQCDALFLSIF